MEDSGDHADSERASAEALKVLAVPSAQITIVRVMMRS
jgi:hypothetical protein